MQFLARDIDDDERAWIRAQAPLRTHGIVTGLPREETIRPPDSPGFRAWADIDGRRITGGDIFTAEVARTFGKRTRVVPRQFVFRRQHVDTGEVTAWGPVNCGDDGWHTFRPDQLQF